MELLLGFAIAVTIGLTGTGAGSLTAPALILLLHVPVPEAVGTALAFSAAVKLVAVPVQMWRGQVAYRALGRMLLTGVPGVLLGFLFFERLASQGNRAWLYFALGATLALSSGWRLCCCLRPGLDGPRVDRPRWLAAVMLPVGADVGLSSSGSGALASVALLSFTALDPATVVGTDLAFGLCVSLLGGIAHLAHGGWNPDLLGRLTAGGVVGILAGLGLARRVPVRIMRPALSAWLLIVGVELCWYSARLGHL